MGGVVGYKSLKLSLSAILALAGMALAGASAADTIVSATEYSYDMVGRPKCTAVRMNKDTFAEALSDACVLKAQGTQGPDRIAKTVYDAAGQVTEVWRAVGVVGTEQRYAAYTYSNNGLKTSETDARGNKTTLEYDAFDRLKRLVYPHSMNIGQSNGDETTGDYERFTYDANGNRLTFRRRDNQTISYQYDNLNREIYRDIPGSADKDVYTVYDLQGRVLSKSFNGYGNANGVFYSYDGLGRVKTSTDKAGRVVAYRYNEASGRTRMTYPGNDYVSYVLDDLNRLRTVSLNDTSTLFAQAYGQTGQRRKLARGISIPDSEGPQGCVAATGMTCYGYDGVGRLTSLKHDPAATEYDVEWTFQYNPAQQLINLGASTTAYDYRQTAIAQVNKTFDGLNRDTTITAVAGGYDARGNLTSDTPRTFSYDIENRLLTATGAGPNLTLEYDAEGRLYKKTSGTDVTSFVYDGVNLIGEFEGETTTYRRRYVHGTGVDEPLVWFDESGTTNARYFWQNYQGSVVAWSDSFGDVKELYKYGPYGEPKKRVNASIDTDSWGGAPFRYTGQVMLADARLYYYKARVYDPNHARFLQTDPIGSDDDLNLYAYTAGDPINKTDPTGEAGENGRRANLPTTINQPRTIGGWFWGRAVESWNARGRKMDPTYRGYTYVGEANQQSVAAAREMFARAQASDANSRGINLASSQPGAQYQYAGRDPLTKLPVGRFIADSNGNIMIEPVGGRTVSRGGDTHTTYPNGSNYQRLNPNGHPNVPGPHGHGHKPGPGPGPTRAGQGDSIDVYGNVVPPNSKAAHWPIRE